MSDFYIYNTNLNPMKRSKNLDYVSETIKRKTSQQEFFRFDGIDKIYTESLFSMDNKQEESEINSLLYNLHISTNNVTERNSESAEEILSILNNKSRISSTSLNSKSSNSINNFRKFSLSGRVLQSEKFLLTRLNSPGSKTIPERVSNPFFINLEKDNNN